MSYLPYEPQQQSLLPQALQDGLPEGHLAYFISVAIDSLDLRTFYARYEGGGSRNQPFHPAMMDKPHTALMADKLLIEAGKPIYRRRKCIAEPPNGWIKSVWGFRQFSLRGLHRVAAEWKLVCMAVNLRRMSSLRTA